MLQSRKAEREKLNNKSTVKAGAIKAHINAATCNNCHNTNGQNHCKTVPLQNKSLLPSVDNCFTAAKAISLPSCLRRLCLDPRDEPCKNLLHSLIVLGELGKELVTKLRCRPAITDNFTQKITEF